MSAEREQGSESELLSSFLRPQRQLLIKMPFYYEFLIRSALLSSRPFCYLQSTRSSLQIQVAKIKFRKREGWKKSKKSLIKESLSLLLCDTNFNCIEILYLRDIAFIESISFLLITHIRWWRKVSKADGS